MPRLQKLLVADGAQPGCCCRQVDDELEIKAYYAGHVLGAAMVHIKVGSESVVYTVSVSWLLHDALHPPASGLMESSASKLEMLKKLFDSREITT